MVTCLVVICLGVGRFDDESGIHYDYEVWLEKLAPEKNPGKDNYRVIFPSKPILIY